MSHIHKLSFQSSTEYQYIHMNLILPGENPINLLKKLLCDCFRRAGYYLQIPLGPVIPDIDIDVSIVIVIVNQPIHPLCVYPNRPSKMRSIDTRLFAHGLKGHQEGKSYHLS